MPKWFEPCVESFAEGERSRERGGGAAPACAGTVRAAQRAAPAAARLMNPAVTSPRVSRGSAARAAPALQRDLPEREPALDLLLERELAADRGLDLELA